MADINERDFRGLDLNLLLVLHALLEERNVTRAAKRLFIGQPAVSGALKRLRQGFADELFVRTSHGMDPTPRALELARTIGPLLASLQQAMSAHPSFDPTTSDRAFRIGLSDSLEVTLMPELMRRLAQSAPNVRVISRVSDRQRTAGLLDSGEIELAVSVLQDVPGWHRRQALFDWTFVCVFSPQHVRTRAKRITLAEYLRYPHVITSFDASLSGYIDDRLKDRGLERRVMFSSPHFATSPLIVRQMPAITTVPTFIAHTWRDALGLSISPLPIEVPTHRVELCWAVANDAEPGLRWLVGEMDAAFLNRRWEKGAATRYASSPKHWPQPVGHADIA
jgi:LysR family transcriptional activator of mexEF-oprN operon